jgi:hypothetical protein
MSTILTLEIVGEYWHNKDALTSALAALPAGSDVIIDVNSEGPALAVFGVLDLLDEFPHKYSFTRWSNPIEQVKHPRVECSARSHFFTMSWRYWIDELENDPADKIFGLFVGRPSVARNSIIYDACHYWPRNFLLSRMGTYINEPWREYVNPGIVLVEKLEDWGSPERCASLKHWTKTHRVPSLDNVHVKEYYEIPEISSAKCATSLLSFYNQFNIELICETYTQGVTFFPTEKTTRPIIGNKPFLAYGPVDYLKNMQKLGFQTFGHLWDEEYDQYEGHQRWQKMRTVIDTICNLDNESTADLLKQCASITRHNRIRLREIINDYKKF